MPLRPARAPRHPAAAALAGLALVALPLLASAADPLQQAIARGKQSFLHETFGGSGRVCNSCHFAGGTQPGKLPDGSPVPSLGNAATIFPRIAEDDGRVITLPDQVRLCVAGAIGGKAPAYGSDQLNALVAYVSSLAQGKPVELGAEPK